MPATPLTLAVLGDSIAYGTGAARPADTLGPRLVAALEAAGIRAEHRVFAVPNDAIALVVPDDPRTVGWWRPKDGLAGG